MWASSISLKQAGLSLVAVLLILELTFVGLLFVMLQQAELEAAVQTHDKEILACSNDIYHDIFNLTTAKRAYLNKNDEEGLAEYDRLSAEIPTLFTRLKTLLAANPEKLVVVDSLEERWEAVFKRIDLSVQLFKQGRKDEYKALKHQSMYDLWYGLLMNFRQFKDEYVQIVIHESPQGSSIARAQFKQVVLAGIALNTLLGLMLAFAFVKQITARVDVLVENARRLGRKKELQPALPGKDEIATLDRSLHDLSASLAEARKRSAEIDKMKQDFIAMVSHDVRTPLTAVKVFIELLADGAYGELNGDGKQNAADSERDIDEVVKLATQIIDAQATGTKDTGSAGLWLALDNQQNNIAGAELQVESNVANEKRSLRLIHKGLLLVGLMLFVEFAFAGSLLWLVNQAEFEAKQEAHTKEIVGASSAVFQLIVEGTEAAEILANDCRHKEASVVFEKSTSELATYLDQLLAVVKNDPAERERVEKLKKESTVGFKVFAMMLDCLRKGDTYKAAAINKRAGKEFKSIQKNMIKDIRQLNDEYVNKLTRDETAVQRKSREEFRGFLLAGLVANVIMSLSIGLIFMRHITSRLSIMIENTCKQAAGETLHAELPGADEIAQLDHVFHQATAALAQTEEKERQSERMKQDFIEVVSQQLSEPILKVQGFLTGVDEGRFGAIDDDGMGKVNRMQKNIDRLMRLVEDITHLTNSESAKLQLKIANCNIASIASRAIEAVNTAAEGKRITIKNECSDRSLRADEGRLIQVIVNLLGNALKFSPQNSAITVSTVERGDEICVRVSDQGSGIPENFRKTIFEKFKQVNPEEDRARGGSGLGLAICTSIVEAHGGRIDVESEVGRGSTFWFTVPRR